MSIGPKIRARRRQLGLTLQDIAQAASLSKPFLSQVERDLATPSMTSLVGIARALGVSLDFFVDVPEEGGIVTRGAEQRTFTLAPSANQYTRLTGSVAQRALEALKVVIAPHTQFKEVATHAGEEFLYVLEGQLHLEVGEQKYELTQGDSAHYLATAQHLWANLSAQECVVLWVGTPKLF